MSAQGHVRFIAAASCSRSRDRQGDPDGQSGIRSNESDPIRHSFPEFRPRSGRAQDPTTGRVVVGQLRHRRLDPANRRRAALRIPRSQVRLEGARCRRRQRHDESRGGAALVRRHFDRLRAGLARSRPCAGQRRRHDHRLRGGRRRKPAVRRQQFRCRGLDLRRHVHAEPGPRRGRTDAGVPAQGPDWPRQLDAGRFHRAGLQDAGQISAAAGRHPIAGAVGHPRRA